MAFPVPLFEGHAVGSDFRLDDDFAARLFGDILRLHGDRFLPLKFHFRHIGSMIEARQILQISVRRRERDRDGGRRHGLFERDGDPFRGGAVRIDHFADGHRKLSAFGGDGRLDGAFTIIRKIFLSRELVNGLRRDKACLERLRRIEGDVVTDGDGWNGPVERERPAERLQRRGVQIGVFDVRDNDVLFIGKFRGDKCSK